MATVLEGSKAKTARRVIEVLEFFDDEHRQVTVMDIVRRYNRPQSSTSELLASLVELGLLYKNPGSRAYTLTPRAAILGSLSQPSMVRDGSLSLLIDRLVAQTGLCVALFGMVGLNAQIFRWTSGTRFLPGEMEELTGGSLEKLVETGAGWLLLSTLTGGRRDGLIRRLNAEATDEHKFNYPEMVERVADCGRKGFAVGPAGYESGARVAAILLPSKDEDRPMALGFVYQEADGIDPQALVDLLQKSVGRCLTEEVDERDVPESVSSAA